mmetsp:Transcript_59692/g.182324  ORF Transcript_59692/g.182324 Transcript_59692/m.182324 type:complete len:295 (-) Transcript_59692:397-1281(-)
MRREIKPNLRGVLGVGQHDVVHADLAAVEVHRLQVQGEEIIAGLDAAGGEVIPQTVPRLPVLGLDAKNPWGVNLSLLHAFQVLETDKLLAVPSGKLPALFHDFWQLPHLRADEGRPEAVHLGVGRRLEMEEVICRVEAMVDQRLQAVVVLRVPGMHPAAVAGGDRLVRVQRRHREVPEGADEIAAVVFGPHGLADILDKPPAPLLAQRGDSPDVFASHPIRVADDDGLRPGRRLLQQLLPPRVERAWRAIAIKWLGAYHLHHVRHGHHGKRRHQDVVLGTEVAGQQRHVECGRA